MIRLVVLMYVRFPLSLRNVLESYITKTRDKKAVLRFMKKALKRHGSPEAITTDCLRSSRAAMAELGDEEKEEVGRWGSN